MAFLEKIFGTQTAREAPQPLRVGAPASLHREVGRAHRLFLYLEQKGSTLTADKRQALEKELQQRLHAIAAKGHPYAKSKTELEESFQWLQ